MQDADSSSRREPGHRRVSTGPGTVGEAFDFGRRLTGWIAILAAALGWFTLAALDIAAGSDLESFFQPDKALDPRAVSVQWFRIAMLTDSFSFYLPFLVIGGYLWPRLRRQYGALTDIATLGLVVYVVLGIAGTSMQFAAIGPLAASFHSIDTATRGGAANAWLALVYSTQRGLWWFEGPVMAFWAFAIGWQLRASRLKSWPLLIVAGALYAAYFISEGFASRDIADSVEAAAVAVLPLWMLFFGIEILRKKLDGRPSPDDVRVRDAS